jgi:hypothetical protein
MHKACFTYAELYTPTRLAMAEPALFELFADIFQQQHYLEETRSNKVPRLQAPATAGMGGACSASWWVVVPCSVGVSVAAAISDFLALRIRVTRKRMTLLLQCVCVVVYRCVPITYSPWNSSTD